ncbi:alpha/beta hydrolase [Intrasporangium sp.]|uniref:alpha/beta fold hydrolase n=1 Tax=Intrasporangium sp. TaxID=1925024 RepID=UPI00293B2F0B|nr:alpha/beta hydrolase [Intrasporangium sp.]MDV3222551.1 alpha/beta hydrolase [Intrasporangium sp.]
MTGFSEISSPTSSIGHVASADGTRIALERYGPAVGSDPPLVLVHAAMRHRANDPQTSDLARRVAARGHTAVVYDRRGRGGSGSAPTDPTDERILDREVEDLAAVVDHVGGRAAVLASSSGAVLALWAAASDIGIERLVMWEAPLALEGQGDGGAFLDDLRRLQAAGDREGLIRHYMSGMPPEWLAGLRSSPEWPDYLAVAPTLVHDAAALHEADLRPWSDQWSGVRIPVLALSGEETLPFFPVVCEALAAALPDAHSERLAGAGHGWDADAMTDRLVTFLAG